MRRGLEAAGGCCRGRLAEVLGAGRCRVVGPYVRAVILNCLGFVLGGAEAEVDAALTSTGSGASADVLSTLASREILGAGGCRLAGPLFRAIILNLGFGLGGAEEEMDGSLTSTGSGAAADVLMPPS